MVDSLPSPAVFAKPYSFRNLLVYFLNLGTFGFGGPIALVGYMERDLVEERRWLTKEEYLRGLALAQLAPGPLAILDRRSHSPKENEPCVVHYEMEWR